LIVLFFKYVIKNTTRYLEYKHHDTCKQANGDIEIQYIHFSNSFFGSPAGNLLQAGVFFSPASWLIQVLWVD